MSGDSGEALRPQRTFFRTDTATTYSESSSNALLGLFFYSGLMFTLPLLAFFGSRQFFEEYFELESPYSQLAPALVAIVVVNLVIVAYVAKALKENAKETQVESIDDRKKKE